MFPADCINGAADNSAEAHAYYVRLPKNAEHGLPVAEVLSEEGETLRIVTEAVSVKTMDETAAALRASNHAVFFAACRRSA